MRKSGAPVFDNSFARLGETFFAPVAPSAAVAPKFLAVNNALAHELGLSPDWLASDQALDLLSGRALPKDAASLAMAYAGDQFGNFVPELGDGRAILLGEVLAASGVRYDLQLKGAGQTPFSRRGDGRAVLGPVLREYLVSEAMAKLNIPTTRALAAISSGEEIVRDAVEPGAMLVRVAQSHIRVGTFQYFAARRDVEALGQLADYVIARHYPEAVGASNPYRALLDGVIARQAALIADWQSVGFIHGVMNTDNMSIAGETIDYGPCAFMDFYHPDTVYSSIDRHGRYAFGNQPQIAQWDLMRLAQALLPLLNEDDDKAVAEAQQAIDAFPALYERAFHARMGAKLGLTPTSANEAEDAALVHDLLEIMAEGRADFTLTFRGLCDISQDAGGATNIVSRHFDQAFPIENWIESWRQCLAREKTSVAARQAAMRAVNPAFIPRNHLVAEVIAAVLDDSDLGPFKELSKVLQNPFDDQSDRERYTLPPRADQVVQNTFCGT